jgi:hypothetical protein
LAATSSYVPGDATWRKRWAGPLTVLATAIPHPRIASLAFAATGSTALLSFLPHVDVRAFDSFLKGQYKPAIQQAVEHLASGPPLADYIELAARASILEDGNTLSEAPAWLSATSALRAIIAKSEDGSDRYGALHKLATNFRCDWLRRLMMTCKAEITPVPLFEAFHMRAGVQCPPSTINPLYVYAFSPDVAEKYLSYCEDSYPSSITLAYAVGAFRCTNIDVPLSGEAVQLATSDVAFRSLSNEEALTQAKQLEIMTNPYLKHKGIRLYSAALLRGVGLPS